MKKYVIALLVIICCFCNILVVRAEEEKELLARFITSYNESNAARSHNISLAADSINGTIMSAKTVLSFNQMTGERTKEKGYLEAKTIYNGEYTVGVGGGVCQVSTTLYNALLLADVTIKEVHAHSIKPAYVLPSRDAMVSFYSHDLVFENTLEHEIVIYAKAKNGSITVDVYGRKGKDEVSYRSEVVGLIPPKQTLIIEDKDGKFQDKVIFKQETYTLTYPQNGMISRLYRKKNGVETLLREDKYLPVQGVIVKGTL